MNTIPEYFGEYVFNDTIMRQRLPKDIYHKMKATMEQGTSLDLSVANVVANAMKDWAIEKQATHYTHWFQPMTGITAEKHESFICPQDASHVILEFSGKELIKGEPDASSFPNGGLRATFEARGYTNWDPTSFAFIKDHTLCIPTVFCSFDGSALDKKTPLLRSMEVINRQAMRIISLFPNEGITHVSTTVGPEQEYFLIDKALYEQRPDLILTGRTLFGAKVTRGQEMEDHYFGMISQRVSAFMQDVDQELWKLGIFAKTEHKEVAPAQFELAPVFTTANIASDQNQLTMEILQKVAERHGFACLLHEKPFAHINGSGKHNNWSLTTNNGINLLEPGQTPQKNARFLLFLLAVVKAVDEYQGLLRVCVATAGNDHRLGANEAPPAIISIFLGDELEAVLDAIENDHVYDQTYERSMKIGVDALPKFPKDTTDRNRTSPFAFTGNKFEFRMLGSSLSISCPNYILNTIVAEELSKFADVLENANDFEKALHTLIKETIQKHKRIIFNGNGYTEEWLKEAKQRGLLNLPTTADAIPYYITSNNIALFTKHGIFNENELKARDAILYETYYKKCNIEALTMVRMVEQDILPAVIDYENMLLMNAEKKQLLFKQEKHTTLIQKLDELTNALYESTQTLKEKLKQMDEHDMKAAAMSCKESILPQMDIVRHYTDQLEEITAKSYWPYPDYFDLLYRS
ncbi:MAG: glutamine synthetase type III [Erysipelotrichaceae bacterium]|nr:glutamine synthetase type III [Erysipelotrichaceae bacterium]MCI9292810.1 glutamine synthetase type III [Erysipelotrichaceae bacterium]MCI9523802.1 glutamine synthetase type III [Erysipelotrichaceae bacterium]